MKKKQFLCIGMIVVCLMSLCGCGTDKASSSKNKTGNTDIENVAGTDTNTINGDTHPYIGTKKEVLRATDTVPEIDAEKDALYDMVGTKISLEEFNLEYWENKPMNNSAVVYLTYDKDYLYLYVEVSDDIIDYSSENQVWLRDSVGVILDFNYCREKVEYSGDNIGYVNIACNNTHQYYHEYLAEPYCSMISYRSRIDEAAGTYAIEMRLPFIEGFAGGAIGFEVTNTDCIDGERCGVRTWNVDGSQIYKYTHCTGTLEFETNFWK